MKIFTPALVAALTFACTAAPVREPQSENKMQYGVLPYKTGVARVGTVQLRTGVYYENRAVEFKGCVIYLQGLADSIANHENLFSALSKNGFRVLAFDYMGQGGSSGSMNHTRVKDKIFPSLEIGRQAKLLWTQHSQNTVNGFSCLQSRRMVIGWSTGGLAAYDLAQDKWADSVVLIAPGIHPNKLVGEAAASPALLVTLKPVISERTLTRANYSNQMNPHVDPIKPDSPAKVPLFAANLLATSLKSRFWSIDQNIKGLVFVGTGDSYIDYAATKKTLAKRAPHFSVVQYEGALHELHNEIPQVSEDVIQKILNFF